MRASDTPHESPRRPQDGPRSPPGGLRSPPGGLRRPPEDKLDSRFQELDSVPAQGTAAVWAGEPEMGRDEVMVFDRDEDD